MFLSSGAVLIIEILSLRLVAPYVGLTIETSTAIIGFTLAAIAFGVWAGGRLVDKASPERLLGPSLLLAGALVMFISPIVRWTGERVRGGDRPAVLGIAAAAVFLPAALLSAVSPVVVKLRLFTLSKTGTVVGRVSGVGTLGALVATFGTGFLLFADIPTGPILLALGGILVVVGLVLTLTMRRQRLAWAVLAVGLLGAMASAGEPKACDLETAYHCAQVLGDPYRRTGRLLKLDTMFHSYVDLADQKLLAFPYIRAMATVIDAVNEPARPLDALHIGGGGVNLPRYLVATRPGSRNVVFEIDRGVVRLARQRLGLRRRPDIELRVQDARVGLAKEPSDSRDVVVGDAFGGLSVPWHLTTRQTLLDIRRILRPRGTYVVNVIDYPPLRFARAEVATMRQVFRHVAVISLPEVLAGVDGYNLVLVGSNSPLPVEQIVSELKARVPELELMSEKTAVKAFAGKAPILTDDFAPVDQIFTPYSRRTRRPGGRGGHH